MNHSTLMYPIGALAVAFLVLFGLAVRRRRTSVGRRMLKSANICMALAGALFIVAGAFDHWEAMDLCCGLLFIVLATTLDFPKDTAGGR